MSGCADVCLDHFADLEGIEFWREAIVKARKSYVCCECGAVINPGDKYERACGIQEGTMWTAKTCYNCAQIRDAFVCDSWIYGMLWESIRDGMFPIWQQKGPIDCLAKLDTKEARDKCRAEYVKWLELASPSTNRSPNDDT